MSGCIAVSSEGSIMAVSEWLYFGKLSNLKQPLYYMAKDWSIIYSVVMI